MKTINVEGVILTTEALDELYFFQTGSSLVQPSNADNSGVEIHLDAVDRVTNLIIEKREFIDENSDYLLALLGDLNHLRNTLKKFRVPISVES